MVPTSVRRRLASACAVALCVGLLAAPVAAADWSPDAWTDADTVELGIVRADGSPHWFKVWVVVLDGFAYVRLGARSAAKIAENRTAPHLGVRVADQEFARVRGEPAPEAEGRVATAMADKYWSDVLVRYVAHPLTLRLRPE
jgi:hypothetical protein